MRRHIPSPPRYSLSYPAYTCLAKLINASEWMEGKSECTAVMCVFVAMKVVFAYPILIFHPLSHRDSTVLCALDYCESWLSRCYCTSLVQSVTDTLIAWRYYER